MTPHIRWMIRRDMPEAIAIESSSFEYPWTEEDFVRCLRQRNCIGIIAEHGDRVVGYAIYELRKTSIRLLNLAVAPDCRRQGVGRAIVEKLRAKLSARKFRRLTLEVRETNLDAQLFFRDLGFRAVNVLRKFYEETDEDAYVMQYRCAAESPALAVT